MKNFALGFLICALIYCRCAEAIDIQMTEITVLDLFAGFVLCGLMGNNNSVNYNNYNPEILAEISYKYARAMVKVRKGK
jgi:hypothetical protein